MSDKTFIGRHHSIDDETSLKYMLKLSAPMVVTTLSFTIMEFVDRFMVSRLGTEALAAILPAGLVSFIPSGFAMGALSSLNTYVSQSLGRGQKQECSKYFWQAVYMGLVYFILVVLIMWPLARWIFVIMDQPSAVVKQEVIYLRIILFAHILAVFNWSCNQFFMGIHKPIITMVASLCGQIVNIVANWVLIFGKFGLPAMGIAGAGWGTFIGIAVAAVINMSIYLCPGINSVYQTRGSLQANFKKMYDLLRVGLPAGLVLTLNVGLWGVILSGLIGRFEENALAANSAVLSYTSLSVLPVVGISMALTAAVGKTIGRGRKELAIKQNNLCLKISLVYMGLMGVVFFIFRRSLIGFLSEDNLVIDAGSDILICAAAYQMFHAARTIYGGSLRGAGDTMFLAKVSAIGAFVILGLGGFLITKLVPSLGAIGPWIAASMSVIFVSIANYDRFRSGKWKDIDLFKTGPVAVPAQTEEIVE